MVYHKKRKSGQGSPSTPKLRNTPTVEDDEDARSGDDEVEGLAAAYDWASSEFDAPFDLTGIPDAVQDKLLAAAPVLRGRNAVYEHSFFRDVVGLCDRGPLVDDVGKAYPQITEASVKQVWRIGAQPNRFEVAKCADRDQAHLFLQFNYKVYGNRPDNFYFAMRFLKAAFATFVHGFDVNWVAEAERRRSKRLATATKNPMKLGPVALRRQIEGLCGILKEVTTGAPAHRSVPASVVAAQKMVDDAVECEAKASVVLQEISRRQDDATRSLMKITIDDIGRVEAEHTDAVKELQRVFRTGTSVQYKEQADAARVLSVKLTQMQEEHMLARDTVNALTQANGPVEHAKAEHSKAQDMVKEAQVELWSAKRENLILRPRPVFKFPFNQSVPPISSPILPEICPLCDRGFVAKAAILGPCNCLFHAVCIAEMVDAAPAYICPTCEVRMDPAWIAQFNGKVTEIQDDEIEATHRKLEDVAMYTFGC